MAVFVLTAGVDHFTGLPGQHNTFFFTSATLQTTDLITGGATGGFMDFLELTTGDTIIAAQLAGVTSIEQLLLPDAGANVTLPDSLVAASSLRDTLFQRQFDVAGGSGADTVDGSVVSSAVLVLAGFGGNDVIKGGSADDIIDGGTGIDTMAGGAGNDLYFVDNEADTVIENPSQGSDSIYSTVNYTLSANVESLYLVEGAAAAINGAGNSQQNFIYGNSNDNALSGYEGDDVLIGGAGNDILDGGPGDDVMVGGTGNDTYHVDSEADVIVENPGEGIDIVFATINYTSLRKG
jgi:Ca2+-binding RTX toxin-like protein